MEEVVILFIQVFVEALLYFPWELLLSLREDSKHNSPKVFEWSVLSFLAGGVIGAISLLLLPHVIISNSRFRFITLFICPLFSAFLSGHFASKRSSKNEYIKIRTHFWGAFMCTLAIVVIRFAFAQR